MNRALFFPTGGRGTTKIYLLGMLITVMSGAGLVMKRIYYKMYFLCTFSVFAKDFTSAGQNQNAQYIEIFDPDGYNIFYGSL